MKQHVCDYLSLKPEFNTCHADCWGIKAKKQLRFYSQVSVAGSWSRTGAAKRTERRIQGGGGHEEMNFLKTARGAKSQFRTARSTKTNPIDTFLSINNDSTVAAETSKKHNRALQYSLNTENRLLKANCHQTQFTAATRRLPQQH